MWNTSNTILDVRIQFKQHATPIYTSNSMSLTGFTLVPSNCNCRNGEFGSTSKRERAKLLVLKAVTAPTLINQFSAFVDKYCFTALFILEDEEEMYKNEITKQPA